MAVYLINSNGGEVNVYNYGQIQTIGKESRGIFAQSIRGGGGNGSFNVSVALYGGQDGFGCGGFRPQRRRGPWRGCTRIVQRRYIISLCVLLSTNTFQPNV